jgi:hypothetical protein
LRFFRLRFNFCISTVNCVINICATYYVLFDCLTHSFYLLAVPICS